LIFWNTDWDRLAAVLGEDLQKNPLEGVKVIEYTGNKDWPGIHNKDYCKKCEYAEDIPGDYLDRTWRKEESFYKKNIMPHHKKLIKEYKPCFTIELHSTLYRQIENDNGYEFIIDCYFLNSGLVHFLETNIIKKKDHFESGFGLPNDSLFDSLEIDVLYSDIKCKDNVEIKKNIIDDIEHVTEVTKSYYNNAHN